MTSRAQSAPGLIVFRYDAELFYANASRFSDDVMDLIATPGTCLANASFLREMLAFKKVPVYLNATITEIGDGFVMVKQQDGTEIRIECDSVVNGIGFVPAPIAADDQRFAVLAIERVEDRLDEVFEVTGLLENFYLFAQAGGSRFLADNRSRGNGKNLHILLQQGQRREARSTKFEKIVQTVSK